MFPLGALASGYGGHVHTLIWDLDGTLIDSGPTIIAAMRSALAVSGLPEPGADSFRKCIGPPIAEGLPTYLGVPADRLAEVTARYHEHYDQTMTTAPLYPGVVDLLTAFRDAGAVHAIATAKPETTARTILAAKDLTGLFTVITGADAAAGIHDKDDVLGLCLARLDAVGADAAGAVMIGDRTHDMQAAVRHGVAGILAGWGYGTDAEAAGFPIARDVAALARLLRSPRPARKIEPTEV